MCGLPLCMFACKRMHFVQVYVSPCGVFAVVLTYIDVAVVVVVAKQSSRTPVAKRNTYQINKNY